MSAGIIVFAVIFSIVNFFSIIFSTYVAIKAVSKEIANIIDECEKIDRDEIFVKQWTKHNR